MSTIQSTAYQIQYLKLLKALDWMAIHHDYYDGELMVLENELKDLLRRK